MRAAAAALLVTLLSGCDGRSRGTVDLIDLYPSAEKRSSLDQTQAFSVTDATIDGTSRRVVLAHTPARVTWTIDVPPAARVRAWVALRPDAWEREGDGVVFRIGISVSGKYEVLARAQVDPHGHPGDRRWTLVEAPLDAYAGKRVSLVFSTDASDDPSRGDSRNDLALWGDPAVVTRDVK